MFASYDPLAIQVTFNEILVVGFMDGTFVEATRDEDAYSKKVGANGDVARVKNRNRAGSVKLTLMQTSPTNIQLSTYHAVGELVPLTPADVGQLQVKDLLGGTLLHATNAWIKKVTPVSFAKELSGREWVFDCAELSFVVA